MAAVPIYNNDNRANKGFQSTAHKLPLCDGFSSPRSLQYSRGSCLTRDVAIKEMIISKKAFFLGVLVFIAWAMAFFVVGARKTITPADAYVIWSFVIIASVVFSLLPPLFLISAYQKGHIYRFATISCSVLIGMGFVFINRHLLASDSAPLTFAVVIIGCFSLVGAAVANSIAALVNFIKKRPNNRSQDIDGPRPPQPEP